MSYRAGPIIPVASRRAISPFSRETMGPVSSTMILAGLGSAAYPLANLALFVPLEVLVRTLVYEVWWENGSVTGGNVDVGIYDRAGTRLASLGSTDRGSASAIVNSTTWTDYTIEPGLYYMAFAHDGTQNIVASASSAALFEALGVCEATSSFPLPSTATLARTTRAYVPNFGLELQGIAV